MSMDNQLRKRPSILIVFDPSVERRLINNVTNRAKTIDHKELPTSGMFVSDR